MANDSSNEALREFLRTVEDAGRLQLELDVSVEVAEGSSQPTIRLSEGRSLGSQSDGSVLLHLESPDDSTAWIAEARWTSSGDLRVTQVRRAGSDASTLQHSRSSYRVAIPPSSVAVLHRLETDESTTVEPVDISRGGIGLRADGELTVQADEPVEVDLNIAGEFADTLDGRVAFARREEQRDQTRIGVRFDDLRPAVEEALRSTLNKILLGQTQELV